jgi:hypothetical protein
VVWAGGVELLPQLLELLGREERQEFFHRQRLQEFSAISRWQQLQGLPAFRRRQFGEMLLGVLAVEVSIVHDMAKPSRRLPRPPGVQPSVAWPPRRLVRPSLAPIRLPPASSSALRLLWHGFAWPLDSLRLDGTNDLFQGFLTQQVLSFGRVISQACRELIDEPERVRGPSSRVRISMARRVTSANGRVWTVMTQSPRLTQSA